MSSQHQPDDDDHVEGVKPVDAIVPAALQALVDGSAARREKRLRALRSLHQRTRAANNFKMRGFNK